MSSPLSFMLYDTGYNPGQSEAPTPFDDTSGTEGNSLLPLSETQSQPMAEQPAQQTSPLLRYNSPRDLASNALFTQGVHAVGDMWNLLKQGGEAATGDLPIAQEPGPNQLSMPEFSAQLALGGMAGGAMFAPEGEALGMFAGRRALEQPAFANRVADFNEFKRLEGDMIDQNPDRPLSYVQKDELFSKTGWFRMPDGDARFIISDKDAKLNYSKLYPSNDTMGYRQYSVPKPAYIGGGLKLKDVLDHPDLYDAYPHLGNIDVRPAAAGTAQGTFNRERNMITLATNKGTDMLNWLLHEVQHAVQVREGFARGGSVAEHEPSQFEWDQANKDYHAATEPIRNAGYDIEEVLGDMGRLGATPEETAALQRLHAGKSQGIPSDQLDALAKAHEVYDGLHQQEAAAFDNYWKMHGEQESRITQAQHYLQDWSQPPWRVGGLKVDNRGNRTIEPFIEDPIIKRYATTSTPVPQMPGYYHIYNPQTQQFHIGEHMPDGFDPFSSGSGSGENQ